MTPQKIHTPLLLVAAEEAAQQKPNVPPPESTGNAEDAPKAVETSPPELWRAVSINADYQISSLGRIRSHHHLGSLMKPYSGVGRDKYLRVRLRVNGINTMNSIHRLVAVAFIPNPDNKPQVNHKDGDKCNNAASNLEWATASENTYHARRVLGVSRGENSGRAKLSSEDVIEIRAQYANGGVNKTALAKQYGVSHHTIYCLILRRTWSHI